MIRESVITQYGLAHVIHRTSHYSYLVTCYYYSYYTSRIM